MLDELPWTPERLEIIDGVLYVTPAPSNRHQAVAGSFYRLLYDYLRRSGSGYTLISPSDVRRGDQDRNRVQPDVYVVRRAKGVLPADPFQLRDLLLAVEVASPSNPSLDYELKRRLYLAEGVGEYWVASPEERMVSRWRGRNDAGTTIRDVLEWHPPGMTTPLRIDVQDLFADLDFVQ